MRTRILLTALLPLLLTGCDLLQRQIQQPAPPTPTPTPVAPPAADPGPAPAASGGEEFQGYHLTVEVNGTQTARGPREPGSEQLWTVAAVGNPITLSYQYDEKHMGAQGSVEVVVNPKSGGGYDPTNLWQPLGVTRWTPGTPVQITRWRNIAGGQMKETDGLPPGDYQLHFRVVGAVHAGGTWDRQTIRLTVQ